MFSPSDHYPSGLPKPPEGCRFTPFCPSPEQTEELVHALASPEFSLRSIAEQHGTTLEALTAWMARPDIQERLDNLEQACARRVRLVSNNHLQSTVTCLTLLIDDFKDEVTHTLLPHGKAPPLHILEHRRRSRDTIRKVCWLILRLANYHPSKGPPRQRCVPTKPRPPAPEPPSIPDLLQMVEQAQAALVVAGLAPPTGYAHSTRGRNGKSHPGPPGPAQTPNNSPVPAATWRDKQATSASVPPATPDPRIPETASDRSTSDNELAWPVPPSITTPGHTPRSARDPPDSAEKKAAGALPAAPQ